MVVVLKRKSRLKSYSSYRISMSERVREEKKKNVLLRNLLGEKADMTKALREAEEGTT